MFTGLIRHRGALASRGGASLRIACPELAPTLTEGDSVAVNGVCLTAVRIQAVGFGADLLPATLERTTLGRLPVGTALNLEPALRAGEPLGGHLVQGHVDGTTTLAERAELSGGRLGLSFGLPAWLEPQIVLHGSIAVDGVSLTVQSLEPDRFGVELIPETLARTTLGDLQLGDPVNLEADLIVKTVSRLLARAGGKPTL